MIQLEKKRILISTNPTIFGMPIKIRESAKGFPEFGLYEADFRASVVAA
jgi:hypothetical protein